MTLTDPATEVAVESRRFVVDVEATTSIDSPAERCWQILTDTAAYPEWNPFIRRLDGAIVDGSSIEVELHLEGRPARTMTPRIVAVTPGSSFEWAGRVGVPGLLDGRHRFLVRDVGDGRSQLVHSERLSGALVPAFRRMLTVRTPAAFVAMNAALKDRAEDGH